MLIAEDLVLLTCDDDTGKLDAVVPAMEYRLAGALLSELALLGRIALSDDKRPRAEVLDPSPTGDPPLDRALGVVAQRPRSFQDVVATLGTSRPTLSLTVLERLAERGILTREDGKVLRIFPVTRWPAADSSHETLLRAQLAQVLVHGQEPDPHSRTLLTLIAGTSLLTALVPAEQRQAAKARVEELAAADPMASAASAAAQASVAATDAAVMVVMSAAVFSN